MDKDLLEMFLHDTVETKGNNARYYIAVGDRAAAEKEMDYLRGFAYALACVQYYEPAKRICQILDEMCNELLEIQEFQVTAAPEITA